MNLIFIAKDYFKTFSNKEIKKLGTFFSDDISLRDWDISAIGLNNVLKANSNIFNSVETISVQPIKIYQCDSTIIAELEILINSSDKILVVDVIEFDNSGRILSIRAYKGN